MSKKKLFQRWINSLVPVICKMETLVYDKGKIAFSSQKFYNKIYHFPIANEVILKIME